jgi:hypothetical protein
VFWSCFCGCERPARITAARINKLGVRHDRALEGMRTILGGEREMREDADGGEAALDAPIASNESFIEQGEQIRSRLAAFVHGDASIGRGDRRDARAWQRQAFRVSRGAGAG